MNDKQYRLPAKMQPNWYTIKGIMYLGKKFYEVKEKKKERKRERENVHDQILTIDFYEK